MTAIAVRKNYKAVVAHFFVAALLAVLATSATADMVVQRDWVIPPPGGRLTVPPVNIGGAINDCTGNLAPEEGA